MDKKGVENVNVYDGAGVVVLSADPLKISFLSAWNIELGIQLGGSVVKFRFMDI